jgi:hypothetical protein
MGEAAKEARMRVCVAGSRDLIKRTWRTEERGS